ARQRKIAVVAGEHDLVESVTADEQIGLVERGAHAENVVAAAAVDTVVAALAEVINVLLGSAGIRAQKNVIAGRAELRGRNHRLLPEVPAPKPAGACDPTLDFLSHTLAPKAWAS